MPICIRSSFSGIALFLPGSSSGFFSSFLPAIVLTNKHVQPPARTIRLARAAVTSLRVETEKQA
jgi:hypothetical protein